MKLFLKGDRCFKEKCAIERRNYPPGQHGRRRAEDLGYGLQLREKQKVKRIYGVLERSSASTSPRPTAARGSPARTSWSARAAPRQRRLQPRLRRLARPGAPARPPRPRRSERQKINIPSYQVKAGQVVAVRSQPQERRRSARASRRRADAAFPTGWSSMPRTLRGTGAPICRSARTSGSRSRSSSSSSSTAAERSSRTPGKEARICFGQDFRSPSGSSSMPRP